MKKVTAYFLFLVIIFSILYLALNFKSNSRFLEKERIYMGTVVKIKIPVARGEDEKKIAPIIDRAFEEIGRIEGVFSVFKKDSEISKVNRLKAYEKLKIADETFSLIERSIGYSKETKGAFDITVKPLVDLWNISKVEKRIPNEEDIKNALGKVGSQYIMLDSKDKTISFAKENMAIDLGGIAKGYATDRAIGILKDNGIKNAIVNSGGDTYSMGRRSKSELWKIGVRHPRRRGDVILEIRLEDKAIDTSGDYEKFFTVNGKRYSHIIDPRTGYAIGDNVISATTIAGDGATTDAFATALCILGEDGLKIINSMKGIDAILIFRKGDRLNIRMSEGIKKRYDIVKKSNL